MKATKEKTFFERLSIPASVDPSRVRFRIDGEEKIIADEHICLRLSEVNFAWDDFNDDLSNVIDLFFHDDDRNLLYMVNYDVIEPVSTRNEAMLYEGTEPDEHSLAVNESIRMLEEEVTDEVHPDGIKNFEYDALYRFR